MAQECMDLYAKLRLDDVAKVEQCCATGTTAEGKTPKTLVEDMVPNSRIASVIHKSWPLNLGLVYELTIGQ